MQRTTNHDNFGLAVLLFHLLFLGRHPYAGRYLGHGEMPIERAIEEFRFAFGVNARSLQMAPPPGTLDMDQIAPALAPLFERTFNRGSEQPGVRPSAKQWYDAPQIAEDADSRLRRRRGPPLRQLAGGLPVVYNREAARPELLRFRDRVPAAGRRLRPSPEMKRLWEQIEATRPPPGKFPETLLQATPLPPPTPLPPTLETTRIMLTTIRWVALASVVLTLATAWLDSAAYFSRAGRFGDRRHLALLRACSPFGKEALRQRRRWQAHRSAMKQLRSEWNTMAFHLGTKFEVAKMPIADAYEQLKNLSTAFAKEHEKLDRDKVNRQRIRYLQGIFVSEAEIDQIDKERAALLAFYGFETANDIDVRALRQVPQFNKAMVDRLVAWRRKVESAFRYNAAQGLPEADRHALVQKTLRTRKKLQQVLAAGADELQAAARSASRILKDIERHYELEKIAAAQAEADISVAQ